MSDKQYKSYNFSDCKSVVVSGDIKCSALWKYMNFPNPPQSKTIDKKHQKRL